MQKIKRILSILILSISLNIYANELKIISNISVETDYEKDGAKGINISYKYNFLSLVEYDHNDTILKDCTFQLKTKLLSNNEPIEPATGYRANTNNNGDLEFSISLTGKDIEATKFDQKVTQFIPYASMKLKDGENNITIQAEMSGKDATGHLHNDIKEKSDVTFKKPITKTFTINIDYIEVQPITTDGQAWDYAFFKTDAPDVGVTVLVGNTTVYKINVNDTYMFAAGPNAKNITFTISEKDRVGVLIQDIDVLFHDFIAKWNFTTHDKKDGILYTYDKAKGNIKSCNLNFKIN